MHKNLYKGTDCCVARRERMTHVPSKLAFHFIKLTNCASPRVRDFKQPHDKHVWYQLNHLSSSVADSDILVCTSDSENKCAWYIYHDQNLNSCKLCFQIINNLQVSIYIITDYIHAKICSPPRLYRKTESRIHPKK